MRRSRLWSETYRSEVRVTGVVDDLALAHDLADAADAITTARFRA